MKKILSIDDEPEILQCIKLALEREGYEVVTCSRPEQAQEMIRAHDIQLLTLDVRMPKVNGFQIYQELKKKSKEPVPVLFITAYPTSFSVDSDSMVNMWQNDFSDGNTDILYKPFELDTLVEKVQALIGPGQEQGG